MPILRVGHACLTLQPMQTKSLRDLAERLHGIHTETVAEKAGVSTRTVYRIKRGELADASAATVDALNAAIDAMAVEAMRSLKFKPASASASAPAPAAAAPETAGSV